MLHGLNLPGHEGGERIVTVLHRHWFVFVRNILALLLLAVIPAVAGWMWTRVSTGHIAAGTLVHTALVMAGALYYLFLWILMYGYWLDYYLDVFVITNKRIVDIEQAGLFGRTVAEERLYRIQDVTSNMQGILATAMQYGNVYVQTAGKTERFVFEQVPHPERVARMILELTDKIDDRIEAGNVRPPTAAPDTKPSGQHSMH